MQTTDVQTGSHTPPTTAASTPRDSAPSVLAIFAFRAIALYFLTYFLSGQVGDRALPGVLRYIGFAGAPLEWLDDRIGPWLGAHLFGVTDMMGGGPGSGDGPREWIRTLWYAVAALLVAAVWTVVRPRSKNPERGREWFRVFLRYPLAFTMIEYGVMKFARVQFGVLPLHQQMTPLGEFSPSALMWAFMSYSYPYRIFTGIAELLGGTLLLWRRTTTLGALIVFAVMSNVLVMNLSYDVSVKMLAGHLVLMAVILLAPDASRLIRVFVLNRATTPASLPPLVSDARPRWLGYAGAVYVAYAAGTIVSDNASVGAHMHSGRPAPLTGIYDVQSMSRNGLAISGASDPSRWNRVAIESTGFMTIQFPDDRTESFLTTADSMNRQLTVIHSSAARDPRFDYRNYYIPFTKAVIDAVPQTDTGRFVLAMEQDDRSHVRLSGRLRGDSIDVVLRRFDESRRLLANWGSHLVNRLEFSDTWIVAPYSGWPVDSLSSSRR